MESQDVVVTDARVEAIELAHESTHMSLSVISVTTDARCRLRADAGRCARRSASPTSTILARKRRHGGHT
jgi:hypothetical protein